MEGKTRTHDISRLCEALGLDPSSYVSFGKQPGAPRPKSDAPRGHAVIDSQTAAAPNPPFRAMPQGFPAELGRRGDMQSAAATLSQAAVRPMQLVMLSPSGGSGKTTLAAALANVLRARRHSVLLADHSLYNVMPTLFALEGDALGRVSFGLGSRTSAPLPILSRYQQGHLIADFDAWFEPLAAHTEFTFIDGMTDAAAQARTLIDKGARILVPVLPDVVSAMSTATLNNALSTPWPGRVMYVLNRFDSSQGLHRDVRVWLRESLGTRLLPFEIPDDVLLRQLATGAILLKDMAPYLPVRIALESLVELLEKCGDQQIAEVRR